MHIAVDMKNKWILAIEVTKEDVDDGRMFSRLVKGCTEFANVKCVLTDGAYDYRDNFLKASNMDIDTLIRVRKNTSFKLHGCIPRRLAVIEQLGNDGWRRIRGYGYR